MSLLSKTVEFTNVQIDQLLLLLVWITNPTVEQIVCFFPTTMCVPAFCTGLASIAVVCSNPFTKHCEDGWDMLSRLFLWFLLCFKAVYFINVFMNWEFDFWNEELDFTIPKETFFFFPNLFFFCFPRGNFSS